MKRKFKSILSIFLIAVIMAINVFGSYASTPNDLEDRFIITTDEKWGIKIYDEENKLAYIKTCVCDENNGKLYCVDEEGTLEFPEAVDGYTITGIIDGLFHYYQHQYTDQIKKIIIPNTYTNIGIYNWDFELAYWDNYLFGNFNSLRELREVVLPENMTHIPSNVFCYCPKLEKVEIPSSVIWIGDFSFEYCPNLTKTKIPETVKYFGPKAFYNSGVSGRINLGKDGKVEPGAFYNCPNIKGFKVDEENPYHYYSGGVLYNKDKTEMICYLAGKTTKSFKFPYTLEKTTAHAADLDSELGDRINVIANEYLENIELQANLTGGLNMNMLKNCPALKSATIRNPYAKLPDLTIDYASKQIHKRLKENKFTVYGYDKSTAETFAKTHGFKFVSLGKIPNKVFNFSIGWIDKKTVQCTWHKVDGAEKYIVYKSTTNGETWKKAAETKKCSVILENLSSKKDYVFKVCAVVSGKERTPSVLKYRKAG